MKKLLLEWSEPAIEELRKIYEWNIDNYGLRRAKKILHSIRKIAKKIPANPYAHAICYEIEQPNADIRNALVERTYWLVYKIEKERIVILEIVHGAMNPDVYRKIK